VCLGNLGTFTLKTRRHSLLTALVLSLLIVFALPGCGKEQQQTNRSATLGSGSLKWDHFPLSLKADASLQSRGPAHDDLLAAVTFWQSHAHNKPLFSLGTWPNEQIPFTGPANNPTTIVDNAIYFLSPWSLDPKVAGNTTLHSTGNTIDSAVIFLNRDTQLCDADCTGPGDALRTSRRRLLAHELGHFLGFAHVPDRNNIMFPEIQPGGSLEQVQIDQDLLDRLTTL
jgi:hypothetical protein